MCLKAERIINMKSTGIVRKVDELGRIVLPIETRKRLELAAGDGVEIFVEKDRVILKKYEPSCIFCGDADDVVTYREKKICRKCLEELKTKNDECLQRETIGKTKNCRMTQKSAAVVSFCAQTAQNYTAA